MVQPQPTGLPVTGDTRRYVDEQAFLFVWGEPHGRTLGNNRFVGVTCGFPIRVGADRGRCHLTPMSGTPVQPETFVMSEICRFDSAGA
ncbi:hypothetical protein GCM10009677_49490 [Sphaerisporangium rubeum]